MSRLKDNGGAALDLRLSSLQIPDNSQSGDTQRYEVYDDDEDVVEETQQQNGAVPALAAVSDFLCLDFHTNPPQLFRAAYLTQQGVNSRFGLLEFQRFMITSFSEHNATVGYWHKTSLTQSYYEEVTDIPLTFLYQTRDAVSVDPDTQFHDYDESLRKKAKEVLKQAQKDKHKEELKELRRQEMALEREQVAEQAKQRIDRKLEEQLREEKEKLAKETQARAALDVLILQLQAELQRVTREREEQRKEYEDKILALTADTAHQTLITQLNTQLENVIKANRLLEAQILDARTSTPKRNREKDPASDDPSTGGHSSGQKKKHKQYKSKKQQSPKQLHAQFPTEDGLVSEATPPLRSETPLRRTFTAVFDEHIVQWLTTCVKSLQQDRAYHEKIADDSLDNTGRLECSASMTRLQRDRAYLEKMADDSLHNTARLDYQASMTPAAFMSRWCFGGVEDKFVQYLVQKMPLEIMVKCSISDSYSVRVRVDAVDTTHAAFDKESGMNWRFLCTATVAGVSYQFATVPTQITGFFTEDQCFVKRRGIAHGDNEAVFSKWITQQ